MTKRRSSFNYEVSGSRNRVQSSVGLFVCFVWVFFANISKELPLNRLKQNHSVLRYLALRSSFYFSFYLHQVIMSYCLCVSFEHFSYIVFIDFIKFSSDARFQFRTETEEIRCQLYVETHLVSTHISGPFSDDDFCFTIETQFHRNLDMGHCPCKEQGRQPMGRKAEPGSSLPLRPAARGWALGHVWAELLMLVPLLRVCILGKGWRNQQPCFSPYRGKMEKEDLKPLL